MKKTVILLIGLSLLCFVTCCSNPDNNHLAHDVLLSDKELEDRAIFLFDPYVLPVYWWTEANGMLLSINNHLWPIFDAPDYTPFYCIERFNSIEEMKRATEQVMTKKYARENLYPLLEENHHLQEKDGRLYIDIKGKNRPAFFKPVSSSVESKTKDNATLTVVFRDESDNEETHKIELVKENDNWKLNNFPFSP